MGKANYHQLLAQHIGGNEPQQLWRHVQQQQEQQHVLEPSEAQVLAALTTCMGPSTPTLLLLLLLSRGSRSGPTHAHLNQSMRLSDK
jgi:hypothetical protein